MGSLDYHRTVIAYHGCDHEVMRAVLEGQPLENSDRAYDWLGRGVYFWEHGPERALEWAQKRALRGDGVVKAPAVLGAYIHLGKCFDLLDTRHTALLTEAYPVFAASQQKPGVLPLQNRPRIGSDEEELSLRYLDCAVINWFLDGLPASEKFQTVRGAFVEGGPCFPGSRFMTRTHIQIAVRDRNCVLGYFRPAA